MGRNKAKKIPEFRTLEEFQEFWDTHDLTDFEDRLKRVTFEVDIRGYRNLVAVDSELIDKVRSMAKSRGLTTESLINLWLQEKVSCSKTS